MSEVLLKELSNQDIDWMLTIGCQTEIDSGMVLMRQGEPLDALHIVLDGELTVSLNRDDGNPLGRAFAVLEGGVPGREVSQLSSGEMVGEVPFMENCLPSTTVTATTKSSVLTIPKTQLMQKLHSDQSFAAHLYRASAIMLANRLQQMMHSLGHSTIVLTRPQLREALTIFAQMHDSDIEWLIAAGKVQQVTRNAVLIRSGRPIEAMYILLDGAVALNTAGSEDNLLAKAFTNLETSLEDSQNEVLEQELGRLSRGDIVGETLFIEVETPLSVTVKALRDSRLLTIPKWRLTAKLLHDVGFAARFYRVLANILAEKQREIVQRLGYGRLSYSNGESLQQSFANELGNDFLSDMSLAGARFDWMLKKIGI
ncbi:MAG: cyclic nucleotide-binding domain-containing protein [Rivularia sp. (in: Bacteria)]|nr:cyclic nucleotide-binding domain-containing protein [Rivularia sp. MS3]